jgi:methylphosphotriester-DNA--protein-cysteine methyltransferase
MNNPPAFPRPYSEDDVDGHCYKAHVGMTLRDYMAAKAMQGLLARIGNDKLNVHDVLAQRTYQIADEMLKAREQ